MERYVDVEVLKENFAKRLNQYDGISINVDDVAVTLGLAIADTPTADVVEVKHSRWENISGFDVCNICGTSPAYCEPKPNNKKGYPPYCHNCGAKMDGVRKEDV